MAEKIHRHHCPRVIKEAATLYINIRRAAVEAIEGAIGVPVWIQHLHPHCCVLLLILNPSIVENHYNSRHYDDVELVLVVAAA